MPPVTLWSHPSLLGLTRVPHLENGLQSHALTPRGGHPMWLFGRATAIHLAESNDHKVSFVLFCFVLE